MGRKVGKIPAANKSIIIWVVTCWLSLFAISPAHSLTHLTEADDVAVFNHCNFCCQYAKFNACLPVTPTPITSIQQSFQLIPELSFVVINTLIHPYLSRAPPFFH